MRRHFIEEINLSNTSISPLQSEILSIIARLGAARIRSVAMKEERLPATNENGYYEIRLESIGGLGANLCGKLIGELALRYMGKNSAGFSSYGSEKSGTPVKAYIRLCDWAQEIRTHSPVVYPHLLAVFHEALLAKENTLEGITRDTVVLVNSEHTPDKLKEKYALCAQNV